jgi:hypothetical protein
LTVVALATVDHTDRVTCQSGVESSGRNLQGSQVGAFPMQTPMASYLMGACTEAMALNGVCIKKFRHSLTTLQEFNGRDELTP